MVEESISNVVTAFWNDKIGGRFLSPGGTTVELPILVIWTDIENIEEYFK